MISDLFGDKLSLGFRVEKRLVSLWLPWPSLPRRRVRGGARRIIDGKQRRTSRPAARDTFFRVSVFCVDLQLENGGPRRTASSPLGDFVSYLIKSWIVVDYLKRRRGLLVTCAMHTSACAYYSSIHYELS